MARLYGVPRSQQNSRVDRLLQDFGLYERKEDHFATFSRGMKRALTIAAALVHEPRLLFLDEPTSGLDPEAAKLVRDFIEELKAEGRTIFLCTHNLDEADRLCDRIAIFKSKLITVDTPENLRKKLFGRKVVFHLRTLDQAWLDLVKGQPYVQEVQLVDNRLVVSLSDPETDNPELVRALVEAGADIQFVGELRHSLEDIYLQTIQAEQA